MRGCCIAVIAAMLSAPAAAQAQTAQTLTEGLPADHNGVQRLAPQQRQILATIIRNAATASQLGSLAGRRGETGRLGELAQAMALTNGGLNQTLTQLAGPENLPLRERMDEGELTRLRALAGRDRAAFDRALVGWITSHYPDTIRNVDSLSQNDPRYAALADQALPQLREQLAAAQQLAQAAMESERTAPPY